MDEVERALLTAVLADPDDDTPRAVYADWLQDHGNPRGEFIALQLEQARLPADDPRRRGVEARLRELIHLHGPAWLGPLQQYTRERTFTRGFLSQISLSVKEFLTHADEIFATAPVREVRLVDPPTTLQELASSPHLTRLQGLAIDCTGLSDGQAIPLLACPRLHSLRRLYLRFNALGPAGMSALAWNQSLSELQLLDLQHAWNARDSRQVGNRAVRALAGSPHLTRLTTLILAGNEIGGPGIRDLALSPILQNLQTLNLSGNLLGDEGVRVLTQSPHLGQLTVLDLSDVRMADEGMRALAASKTLGPLTELRLFFNEYSDDGVVALACRREAFPLRKLRLGCRGLTDRSFRALAGCASLQTLQELELSGMNLQARRIFEQPLTPAGFEELMCSPGLAGLRHFSCAYSQFRNPGAEVLARAQTLGRLVSLNLGNTSLTDRGLQALAGSPHLHSLTRLLLPGNSFTDTGMTVLAGSELLARLEELDLCGSIPGPVGLAALIRSPHLGRLRSLDLGSIRLGNEGPRLLTRWPGPGLEELSLNHTALGDEGVKVLAEMPQLRRLAVLDLGDNPITDEGAKILVRSPHLDRLDSLHLPGCELTPAGVALLRERFGERLQL